MNELFFIAHLLLVSACTLFACRQGKMLLTAWICLQAVLANLFVLKQVKLFGAHVTCSDVFAVGMIFGLNLLREYWGKRVAKQALIASFFLMSAFILMAQMHLLYTPSPYDVTQSSYETLLSPSWRLSLASIVTFFIVQQLDLKIFSALKEKFTSIPFMLRNMGSTALSQTLDTTLFSFLGLFGLVAKLNQIILVSTCIKLALILSMGPFLTLAKRLIPAGENENI